MELGTRGDLGLDLFFPLGHQALCVIGWPQHDSEVRERILSAAALGVGWLLRLTGFGRQALFSAFRTDGLELVYKKNVLNY